MEKLALLLILVMPIAFVSPAPAKTIYLPDAELKAEAQHNFEQILDLWRDGKFADLYERSTGGKHTRENFAKKLSAAPRKPACCWEKMQEVAVRLESNSSAIIKARLGLEGAKGTEFQTGNFKLVKEDDTWRISRADIFMLAGAGKKKAASHRKKKQL